MFDSAILDVALGITFVYVLVSLLCSMIREGIEAWLKTRAAYLEFAIRELLHDRAGKGLARSFFNHPMIYALYSGDYEVGHADGKPGGWARGGSLPSYIPARSFALALMDLAARGPSSDASSSRGSSELTLESLRASVETIENPPVQRALLAAIDSAQGSLDTVRANLEEWYQGAMQRVSGWYKRSTQKMIFLIALVVVGVLNVNTLTIADRLYRDRALRSAVVAAAANPSVDMPYSEALAELDGLRLPIGWSGGWGTPGSAGDTAFDLWNDALAPILGLLITAFAATLGAPFWFDVLNKIVTFRSTLKPREAPQEPRPLAAAAPRSAPPQLVPREVDTDGCAQLVDDPTPDEELPVAVGGVAP